MGNWKRMNVKGYLANTEIPLTRTLSPKGRGDPRTLVGVYLLDTSNVGLERLQTSFEAQCP